MTADIRTAAQRQCVNCGKAYLPTSDTQKFCESMCKRENYMKRRYGEEYAAEWRRYKELRAARFTPKPARVTPTREQIAEVLRGIGLTDEPDKYDSSIHSWRCEHPEIYGRCSCFDDAVNDLAALMSGLAEGESDG